MIVLNNGPGCSSAHRCHSTFSALKLRALVSTVAFLSRRLGPRNCAGRLSLPPVNNRMVRRTLHQVKQDVCVSGSILSHLISLSLTTSAQIPPTTQRSLSRSKTPADGMPSGEPSGHSSTPIFAYQDPLRSATAFIRHPQVSLSIIIKYGI